MTTNRLNATPTKYQSEVRKLYIAKSIMPALLQLLESIRDSKNISSAQWE